MYFHKHAFPTNESFYRNHSVHIIQFNLKALLPVHPVQHAPGGSENSPIKKRRAKEKNPSMDIFF